MRNAMPIWKAGTRISGRASGKGRAGGPGKKSPSNLSSFRAFYTGNIFNSGSAASQSDFLHYVSPALQIGRVIETETRVTDIKVSYQPSFVVYTDHGEFNRVDHAARFGLDHSWGEQVLDLEHRYRKTSEATDQTAFLVAQEIHTTKLGYERPLTGKIRMTAQAVQDFRDSEFGSSGSNVSLHKWQGNTLATMDLLPQDHRGFGPWGWLRRAEFHRGKLLRPSTSGS